MKIAKKKKNTTMKQNHISSEKKIKIFYLLLYLICSFKTYFGKKKVRDVFKVSKFLSINSLYLLFFYLKLSFDSFAKKELFKRVNCS